MQTLDAAAHRTSQAGVLERKRANATLKPFIGALKNWNAKAAYLRGRCGSAYSSEEDKTLARLECGALLVEIRHQQGDLWSAIKGEPPHGRLDDVLASFQRLIDQLEAINEPPRNEPTHR